jgi:predicted metal-dependent hydrolase
MRNTAAATPEDSVLVIEIGGERERIALRRSDRARRMTLKIDAKRGGAVLTVPCHVSIGEAQRFIGDHGRWLAARLSALPVSVPFADGITIPLRGEPVQIRHRQGRGAVTFDGHDEEGRIIVHGRAEHIGRRVEDWLKAEARRDLTRAVGTHASAIDTKPAAIRVRDTGTRWGSCSSRKTLSFSWRLVLAPPSVLNYLAAHEVAHLRHMNHGAAFWDLVARLDPHYRKAQAWLKSEGPGLFAIGREV